MNKYLIETNDILDGIQKRYRFPNDFGASVIKHSGSYGNKRGLWELAVLEYYKDDWSLCYSTPITDNVLGWLNDEEVLETLEKIKNL